MNETVLLLRPFLLLTLSLALAGCGNGKPVAEPVRPVVTQKVAAGAPAALDVYSGEVRARYEADLGFRVGGKILARAVDAGAQVRKGQVLARLDPDDARLAAEAARSQLASAESDLALAHAEHERYADLLARKFISASAFDVKRNALDAARARAAQMRSQAALSANQAVYTSLVADADGIVTSVAAEPGQVVAAGQAVLRFARSGEKEVVVDAPEGQLARFRVGDEVGLSLWAAPGRPFRGRIREVAGGADPVTRTYAVRVSAIDPPDEARIGMTASVHFKPALDAGVVLLPLAAIAGERGAPAVWVVDPATSQVKLRRVTLGAYREDGATVLDGVAPGEIVVTAGVHKLRAGQRVRVLEPGSPVAGRALPAAL